MPTVFVFGAGASNGESLSLVRPAGRAGPLCPPLSTGFFREALYESLGLGTKTFEHAYADVLDYIRANFAIRDEFGRGGWADLNIEDVFSSIELHREFVSPDSDAHGRLTLKRNLLTRYIQSVIGFCTLDSRGEYYSKIKDFVCQGEGATVITFNWDLLLDQEFIDEGNNFLPPYARFEQLLQPLRYVPEGQPRSAGPLYLKLHGSLNWFRCTNSTCPYNSEILISREIDDCLCRAEGIYDGGMFKCRRCGSETVPFIVAPILKKPVTESAILRTVWGQAMQRLTEASTVVVVGFSAAPSDFYARWLLRSAVGIRGQVDVLVVNPANDPGCDQHDEFRRRMAAIFPHGYSPKYRTFSQVGDILSSITGG